MSSDRAPEYLSHILQACGRIQKFTKGFTLKDFEEDERTASAVERQMQIISEAAYRLGANAPQLCPGPDGKEIRAIGNVLRHDYGKIELDVIWGAATRDVPALSDAVRQALTTHFLDFDVA